MKKYILSGLFLLFSVMAFAVPAKRGIFRTVRLADGTEIRCELRGDEYVSYWQSEDGIMYVQESGKNCFKAVDALALRKRAAIGRMKATQHSSQRVAIGDDHPPFVGSKKGLVILAEFTDKSFQSGHDAEYYSHVMNDNNFSHQDGFVGSVHDYFFDQSEGQFDLTFDVVGPIKLAHNMAYYGRRTENASDANAYEMIYEAVIGAAGQLGSFEKYDWFGDGYVDQVFVIYAGRGEASGGGDDTIWPHRSQFVRPLRVGGKYVSVYACTNELRSDTQIDGIGTFCHEFSHCLGLPDLYDVAYGGNYGMDDWDLMNSGSYLGESFRPCAYSGYERNYCGWKNPVILTSDTVVNCVKGISEGGDYYIIRNDAYPDEYYILENRSCTGWDASQPGSGLLVTYIDFDKTLWRSNMVNTLYDGYNDHQRYTPIQADNYAIGKAGDLYPYQRNNGLTNRSIPAATLWHDNPDGIKFMSKPITNIVRNEDGTISFDFANEVGIVKELPEGVVFLETFDDCNGVGGNDGIWKQGVNDAGRLLSDNYGWVTVEGKGGNGCAVLGSDFKAGSATTPTIIIDEPMELSFKGGVYSNGGTSLKISVSGANISDTEFTLVSGRWTECKTQLYAAKYPATVKIRFDINRRRFFLDEIVLRKLSATRIVDITNNVLMPIVDSGMYNLMGQRVAPNTKGLLIRNGRKYVSK